MENKKVQNTRAIMESEYDVKDIIVIDNGADSIKIGVSGEDYPRLIIPSVAGIPDIKNDQESSQTKPQPLYGDRLKQFRVDKRLKQQEVTISEKRFINEGGNEVVSENMVKLWEYALKECLQVSDTQACNLLLIDSPHNDKDYKHKIANQLFEELKINSLIFMNSATLSLFSTGTTSGLVLEAGHSLISCVPIFEGSPIPHAIQKSSLAGEEVTKQVQVELQNLLKPEQLADLELVKSIKESICYVARDYFTDLNGPDLFDIEDKSYELPDGKILEIGNKERYTPCEIMFDPTLINDKSSMSIPDMMIDSLNRCDPELKQELFSNIVLCGGSSLFKGFLQRIENEILNKMSSQIQRKDINFVQNSHRRYSAWIGGSMLGSLSTFQSLAITRSEYEENPEKKIEIIHKKSF